MKCNMMVIEFNLKQVSICNKQVFCRMQTRERNKENVEQPEQKQHFKN